MIRGRIDGYAELPPMAADISCVVGVADNPRALDLGPKVRMYASAAGSQYVVMALAIGQVVLHEAPSGDSCTNVVALASGAVANILAGSGQVAVEVGQLLP